MLTHPTLDKLKALKLDGIAAVFAELEGQDGFANLTHAEWLALLVERESVNRETKRFESRMRAARLFDELELAHGDGRFQRLFRTLTKTQLLILDDWGPDRLNASQRHDLLEIVEKRYGNGSTLITSQLPISVWHNVIGEPTFADAILDRFVHNAYRIELEGQSFRKTHANIDDETDQN